MIDDLRRRVSRALPRALKDRVRAIPLRAKSALRLFGPRWCARRVRGLEIGLWVGTDAEQWRADHLESKEPDTLDWLDRNLRDSDVFWDVGANIGVYALYAAALRPGARVLAFEPESQNFAQLCRNIHANRFSNVLPLCVPLGERIAVDRLHVSRLEAGSAFHGLGAPIPSPYRRGRAAADIEQGALAASIDALADLGLPPPDLLKLDVDGIEPAVLRGAERVLRAGPTRGLLVELTARADEPSPAPAWLEGLGFEAAGVGPEAAGERNTVSRNWVFRRKGGAAR